MELKDVADIANLIVAAGVVFAITQVNLNRKQLHFNTLARCVSEFRKFENLKSSDKKREEIKRYIDLVNEELFYFQHNYLPKPIAYEWLDGMLDYMVLLDKNQSVQNPNNCIPALSQNFQSYLNEFPRILETFTIRQHFDFAAMYVREPEKREVRIATRKQVVEELYNNVMNFSF